MESFIIQKAIGNPLVADPTTTVPSIMGHWPGQMPSRKDAEILEFMTRKPQKEAFFINQYPRPVLTIQEIPRNLGFDAGRERQWVNYLENAIVGDKNSVVLRQSMFAKMREEKLDPEQQKILFQKTLAYIKSSGGMDKSLVEVYRIEDNKPLFFIKER